MRTGQQNSRVAIQKLLRQLTKLARKPAAENVHKFRTYGRRVEAILDELVADPDSNHKKLLRLLARLRKKAGRVRDLDVEINSLRNLKVPDPRGQKSQLLRTLAEERGDREKKLAKSFERQSAQELRKRLKRAAIHIRSGDGIDPLLLARERLVQLASNPAPLTEKTLHQYRVAGKRARYLAELAGNDPDAVRLVQQLKRMQDEIGDWHDWLKLAQKAEELFGEVQDSVLVSALRNVTRAKFRQAVDALSEARISLAGKKIIESSSANKPRPAGRQAANVA